MQDKKPVEQGSGAANAIVLFAKILLTLLLLCVLVGGGVCGICIGIMDLKRSSASGEGVALIFFTLLGIVVIGFLLRLLWRRERLQAEARVAAEQRRQAAPPEPEP